MTRKHWTKSEIDSVVQESLRLVRLSGIGPGEAMLAAQDLLPKHKQLTTHTARSLASWNQVLFIAAYRAGLVPEHHVRVARLMHLYPQRFKEDVKPTPPPKAGPSIDSGLRHLFEEFEDRIVERVAQRVLQLLDMTTQPVTNVVQIDGTKVPMRALPVKQVLVVGLIGPQVTSLSRWFDDMQFGLHKGIVWELVCLEADVSVKKLSAACKASETSILMSKFCSHTTQTVMKKHSTNFQICNGATKAVGTMVQRFIETFAED